LVLFWHKNNGDPSHFSENNFDPLAAKSRDCIDKNVNFGPKVPNLPYVSVRYQNSRLPALPAFNAHMRKNASCRNLKRTREDSFPCYCYAIKFDSRTISTQVSQLVSADRQSSGQEWTANSSLHNTRTVNLVFVHC